MKYPSLALWGDSIGRAIDFDSVRGRYAVLRQGFYRLLADRGIIEVDNHARFGATVTEGLQDFEQTTDLEAQVVDTRRPVRSSRVRASEFFCTTT